MALTSISTTTTITTTTQLLNRDCFQDIKMVGLRPRTCVFAVSCYFFALLAIAQVTDPSEVSALIAVKNSLSDNMKHLSSWNKGDPCISNWTGVLCFNVTAADGYLHVRELQLMNMNLSGNLVPELGRLSQLRKLSFMWNELTGSIPKEIGNITSLRLLLLNGNKLSGSLAEELGYLLNLIRFQIDENEISGPIPKSFSNLKSVKHLHFNNNSLSGQIPSELSTLSNLYHLLLDNNNMSGFLPPELSKLPDLRIIQLDNNNFGGSEIPASYGNLSKLVKLSLRNCSLRGAIPDLSRIANFSYLDLSWNQLSGSISSNKYSDNMTTVDLSHNLLNGSVPKSFSYLPSLQKLVLANNLLSGSFATEIWHNKSFSKTAKLMIDLRSNLFSSISGNLDPSANVTLWLQGNPICNNSNIKSIKQFCGSETGIDDWPYNASNSKNSTLVCLIQSCPTDYFEYVRESPIPCFCASPLRIGYRLKSPSFSYFLPYLYHEFMSYMTNSLNLHLYQLSIDSISWEKGPRLRMYLKLFPVAGVTHSNMFNTSEVLRIRHTFSSWEFPPNDFFGPYELLNFTLLGPYSYLNSNIQGKSKSKTVLIAIVIVVVASSMVILAIVIIFITRRHTRFQRVPSRKRTSSKLKIDGVTSFTLKEMALATNDFDNSTKIGQGGYGNVYRGIFADKTIVAIKRAKEGSLQGEREFLTEIELLSRLHHRNLVSLVGYCDEEGEQMLVYEFMANGSLRDWLSAKFEKTLNFGARLRIALGAAKGILYLHTEANPPIFHRDIKASNILLDTKFMAKVADFGLSRLAPVLEGEGTVPDHVSTVVKGTPGYVDPEYFLTRKFTDKSDVYSLGVVFLEILTGMQPITRGKNIVREVVMAHQSGTLFSVLDSKMGSCANSECIDKFMALALWCCENEPDRRPSMLDVVRELENILHMMPANAEVYSSSNFKSKNHHHHHSESTSSPSSSNTPRDLYPVASQTSVALISGVSLCISPR